MQQPWTLDSGQVGKGWWLDPGDEGRGRNPHLFAAPVPMCYNAAAEENVLCISTS
jgi:hypothetical protein